MITKIIEKDSIKVMMMPVGPIASNCTIVFDEKTSDALIVDSGNDPQAINAVINELKLAPKLLLHTHAHFDHIGNSGDHKNEYQALMALHKDDEPLYQHINEQAAKYGMSVGAVVPIDNYIKDGDLIEIPDSSLDKLFKTIHTPGHSPGGCCFYSDFFDTPLLIAGDTLFQGSIGRTDLIGGDYDTLINSIKTKLLSLPENTKVVTGHGPMTTIGFESERNPFLS